VLNEVAGTEAGFRKGGNCCLGWIWAVEMAQMGRKHQSRRARLKNWMKSPIRSRQAGAWAWPWRVGVALARLNPSRSQRFRSDVIGRLTRCPARRIQAA